MQRLALFAATAAYSGYAPVAPGTAGSAVGLACIAVLRWSGMPALGECAVGVALCALGIWASSRAETYFGSFDPGPVVIDEVVGVFVTLAFLSVGWSGAIAGFVLFRIFDVVKPFPSGRVERLPGGWGVMADDVVAGVYAHASLRLVLRFAPGWVA